MLSNGFSYLCHLSRVFLCIFSFLVGVIIIFFSCFLFVSQQTKSYHRLFFLFNLIFFVGFFVTVASNIEAYVYHPTFEGLTNIKREFGRWVLFWNYRENGRKEANGVVFFLHFWAFWFQRVFIFVWDFRVNICSFVKGSIRLFGFF